jgi:hypothetical protein
VEPDVTNLQGRNGCGCAKTGVVETAGRANELVHAVKKPRALVGFNMVAQDVEEICPDEGKEAIEVDPIIQTRIGRS